AEWIMPGNWPTRPAEVGQLVALVGGLRSRFAPIPVDAGTDLKSYGLDKPPLTISVHAGDKAYRLTLGEEAGASNRFSRPTYLRLDDRPESVRLAPGLVAALDRPQDYYQQRRLFASERIAKEDQPQEKIERLAATAINAKSPTGTYDLTKAGDDWEL